MSQNSNTGGRSVLDPNTSSPGPLASPVDGQSVTAEFSLSGLVPRKDVTGARGFKSDDVFVRLENTIYGPLSRDELADLLASGQLTGYESASSDLQHWTPLLYHPRMALTGRADPDRTHELLHEKSSLPQASRSPRRVSLEDIADEVPEAIAAATPLAAIMVKKIRRRKDDEREPKKLALPVYKEVEPEEEPPAVAAAVASVFRGRPAHPSDQVAQAPDPLDFASIETPEAGVPRQAGRVVGHTMSLRPSAEPVPSHDIFSVDPTPAEPDPAALDDLARGAADPFAETAMVSAVDNPPAASTDAAAPAPAPAQAKGGSMVPVIVVTILLIGGAVAAWLLLTR